jgi:hypothetical protein
VGASVGLHGAGHVPANEETESRGCTGEHSGVQSEESAQAIDHGRRLGLSRRWQARRTTKASASSEIWRLLPRERQSSGVTLNGAPPGLEARSLLPWRMARRAQRYHRRNCTPHVLPLGDSQARWIESLTMPQASGRFEALVGWNSRRLRSSRPTQGVSSRMRLGQRRCHCVELGGT